MHFLSHCRQYWGNSCNPLKMNGEGVDSAKSDANGNANKKGSLGGGLRNFRMDKEDTAKGQSECLVFCFLWFVFSIVSKCYKCTQAAVFVSAGTEAKASRHTPCSFWKKEPVLSIYEICNGSFLPFADYKVKVYNRTILRWTKERTLPQSMNPKHS